MISAKELKALWGTDSIVVLPPALLADASIPQASKAFLSESGLPHRADLLVTFDISERGLQTLSEFAQAGGLHAPLHGERFYRIGTDGGTQICLAVGSGEVVAVDVAGQLPDRFVNSTIQQFIGCLGLFRMHSQRIQGLPYDEIDRMVPAFEESVRSIDPKALAECENWWSVILEQMRDGLL